MARRRRLIPAQPGYLGPDPVDVPTDSGAVISRPTPPIAQVSGQSAEAAALREITDGLQTARNSGRMIVDVPLGDVSPGYLLRDRIMLNRDEMEALKASIQAHGQRSPAEITPLTTRADGAGVAPYRFGLISGWRRLRALSELYDENRDPRFSILRALIRPPEEAADSYVAMVEENEIRVGLSYYERARVVAEATERGVFTDQSQALRSLFATASRAKRSKIGSFIDIHTALGDALSFPAEIPERLGLALVARLRLGGAPEIREALRECRLTTAKAELTLLEKLVRPPRPDVSHAKHRAERLRDGVILNAIRENDKITVTLTGSGVDDTLLEQVRLAVRGLS